MYEIKGGKRTAICGKEQKRFIRFSSLGEDYTEENLKKIIAGEKELPEKNEKVSDQKAVKSEKRKFDLVVDIQEKMAQNKVLKTHIINYAKTRDTYIAYRKSGYRKKFYEAHRDELILHKAAKEAFSKLPDGKIPKVKDLNEEFARLLFEKKQLTVSTKNKKRDAGLSDCEAKCGIILCYTADLESGGRPEKEATATEINLRAIIKMKLGGCPFFCNFGKAKMHCVYMNAFLLNYE